jgi:hypothetical protein
VKQEALLPNTVAIMNQTLEWTTYHGKYLVRYKNRAGTVFRCLTASYAEASAKYDQYFKEMQKEA